jgi:hypothetical protein
MALLCAWIPRVSPAIALGLRETRLAIASVDVGSPSSGARLARSSELLEERQIVGGHPDLDDEVSIEPVHRELLRGDGAAGRCYAEKRARVRASVDEVRGEPGAVDEQVP